MNSNLARRFQRITALSSAISFLTLIVGCKSGSDVINPVSPCEATNLASIGVGPTADNCDNNGWQFGHDQLVYVCTSWGRVEGGDELVIWLKADTAANPYTETKIVSAGFCGPLDWSTSVLPAATGRWTARAYRNGTITDELVFYH